MPTCFGEKYIDTALGCFMEQDYDDLELVIVDNNAAPVDYTGWKVEPDFVKIIRTTRKPVGHLRNEGIRAASGEVICIWDEDDWYAPNRVAEQVSRLCLTGKQVTGWHSVLYWDEATGGTFKYECVPSDVGRYAIGMSHCFRRAWWEKHPYVEQGVEDKIFSDEALRHWELDSVDAGQLYVGRVHGANAVRKNNYLGKHKQWPRVEREALPEQFFDAMSAEKAQPGHQE
jgi:glycosyltransferase involved in cell wall biosynthesis